MNENGTVKEVTEISIPDGIGQIITVSGEIIPVKKARIVPSPKGKIKTSYPIR